MPKPGQFVLHDHVCGGRECWEFLPIPYSSRLAACQCRHGFDPADGLHDINRSFENDALHETPYIPNFLEPQYPIYLDGAKVRVSAILPS